jgi:hypothetical protein
MPGKKSMLYHADDPHTTEKKTHTTKDPNTNKTITTKPHTHDAETGEGVLTYKPFKMMGHTLPGIKQRKSMLPHYSVEKGSHKHPHKKGMPAAEGYIKTVKAGLHKKKK